MDPGADNGSTTTSYTVTATDTSSPALDPNDGGETCTYTVVSPEIDSCTFTSPNLLANGDSYTFTVTGTNGNGTGSASDPSNSVTPSTVPDAPTNAVGHGRQPDGHGHLDPRLQRGLDGHLLHGDGHGHLGLAELTRSNGSETCTYTVVSPEVDSCTFTSPTC